LEGKKYPGGDGVAKILIVPLDDDMKDKIEEVMDKLEELFDLTTFSEETIQFRILELD